MNVYMVYTEYGEEINSVWKSSESADRRVDELMTSHRNNCHKGNKCLAIDEYAYVVVIATQD